MKQVIRKALSKSRTNDSKTLISTSLMAMLPSGIQLPSKEWVTGVAKLPGGFKKQWNFRSHYKRAISLRNAAQANNNRPLVTLYKRKNSTRFNAEEYRRKLYHWLLDNCELITPTPMGECL